MSSSNKDVSAPNPEWISQTKQEIKRLNRKIGSLDKKAAADEMTGDMWDDYENWTGWRDALYWVLRLREGKAKREDAWGKAGGGY